MLRRNGCTRRDASGSRKQSTGDCAPADTSARRPEDFRRKPVVLIEDSAILGTSKADDVQASGD